MQKQGLTDAVQKLAVTVERWTRAGELETTAVPGLSLYRRDEPTEPVTGFYEPSLCMVLQGAKRVELGAETLVYDPGHYLITSVHLPTMVQVIEASPEKPYLGLRLTFDVREVSTLLADGRLPAPRTQPSGRGMSTGAVTPPLLDAVSRLLGLLDAEEDVPILAPILQKEILYRLLVGEEGGRLRQIAMAGSPGDQIARAIRWLKENFAQPVKIDALAARANMSPSSFHQHFRALTAMSPLQYQKQLRLREARQLMLSSHVDAADAAFRVGYESPSQFSREYSRTFGAPPLRDIGRLRRTMEAVPSK